MKKNFNKQKKLQIGDLVRIAPTSQIFEFDLDASKTIRGFDSTVAVLFDTDDPVLGLVCQVLDEQSAYLAVMVENQRWFVNKNLVAKVS